MQIKKEKKLITFNKLPHFEIKEKKYAIFF